MMQILEFSAPVRFRRHFEEITIAKVLLKTKPRCVGKFRDVGFPTSEKVWREKKRKEINSPQNIMVASLSLSLERANIKMTRTKVERLIGLQSLEVYNILEVDFSWRSKISQSSE